MYIHCQTILLMTLLLTAQLYVTKYLNISLYTLQYLTKLYVSQGFAIESSITYSEIRPNFSNRVVTVASCHHQTMDIEYLFLTKMRQWVIFILVIYVLYIEMLGSMSSLDSTIMRIFYTEIHILECCILRFFYSSHIIGHLQFIF